MSKFGDQVFNIEIVTPLRAYFNNNDARNVKKVGLFEIFYRPGWIWYNSRYTTTPVSDTYSHMG